MLVGRCYDLSETPALRPLGRGVRPRTRAATGCPPCRRRSCPPSATARRWPARRRSSRAGARLPGRPRRPPARWSCCWRTCTGPTPPPSTCCASSARGLARPAAPPPRHLPRRRGRRATTRSPPSCPSWCARPAPRGSTCARWTRRPSARSSRRATPWPRRTQARLVGYLAGRTEGNALFLGELLRTLEGEGAAAPGRRAAGSLGDLAAVPVPALLRQVIAGRVARLDPETQRLLAVAAVIGQEVPLALWAAVGEVAEERPARPRRAGDGGAAAGGDARRRGGALRPRAHPRGALRGASPRRGGAPGTAAAAEALAATARARPRRGGLPLPAGGRPARGRVAGRGRASGRSAPTPGSPPPSASRRRWRCWSATTRRRGERGWLLLASPAPARFADPGAALAPPGRGRCGWRGAAGDRALAACAASRAGRCAAIVGGCPRAGWRRWRRAVARAGRALDRRASARRLPALAAAALPADGRPRGGALVARWLAWSGASPRRAALGERLRRRPGGGATRPTPARPAHRAPGARAARCAARPAAGARARSRARAPRPARAIGRIRSRASAIAAELALRLVLPCRRAGRAGGALAGGGGGASARRAARAGDRPLAASSRLAAAGRWRGSWAEAPARLRAAAAPRRPRDYGTSTRAVARRRSRGSAGRAGAGLGAACARCCRRGRRTEPGDTLLPLRARAAARRRRRLALDAGDLPAARAWLEAHDRWLAWSGAVLGRAEGQLGWAAYHRAAGDLDGRARARRARPWRTPPSRASRSPSSPPTACSANSTPPPVATPTRRRTSTPPWPWPTPAPRPTSAPSPCSPWPSCAPPPATRPTRQRRAGRGPRHPRRRWGPRPALARADALAARLAAPPPPPPRPPCPSG